MKHRKLVITLLIMILSLTMTNVFAQDEEMAEISYGYRICEWGLAVIESGGEEVLSDITINSPENYVGIADATFTVTGTGKGLFENNVIVKVTNLDGEILFEEPITMQTEEIGGEGEWSIDITLDSMDSATPIVVEAYSTEPAEGMVTALDNIRINYGSEFGLPFVEVTSPVQFASVNSSPIIVEGIAGAAFENNIVVQILNYEDSSVLAETFATVQTDELAGTGPWTAEFSDLMLDAGTTFSVRAFHPPVADGEDITVDSYGIGVVSPLSQSYDQILVLKESDPYVGAYDFCELTEAEFENENIIPILINDIMVINTMSMTPLVNVTVNAQTPSICDLPVRLRVTGEDNNFAAELYYSIAEGDAMCTRDLQPFQMRFSLGTLPSDIFTVTVNGVGM